MAPSVDVPANDSFWDSAYRRGDHLEHWEPPETPKELVSAVDLGLVRAGQTAVDVGCGAGAEAIFLASRGVFAIGVDTSRVALELARKRSVPEGVSVDWREGSALRLPLPDDSVDFALDRGCLHVVARRRRRRYVNEIARVLRPGGALLLRGAREDDEEAGILGISRREIERRFVPRGFRFDSFEPIFLAASAGDLPGSAAVLTYIGRR